MQKSLYQNSELKLFQYRVRIFLFSSVIKDVTKPVVAQLIHAY